MAKNKEYELAIKIAGKVEKSFLNSTKLSKKELEEIAKSASRASSSIKHSFKGGMENVSGVFGGIERAGKAIFKTVAVAATVAATATIGVATAAISVGSRFEEQMSVVQSISGATGSDLEALTEKAKEMGRTTAFSATEAGQAMEYMSMAGWKTKDMLNSVEGIMNLAAASGEELAGVSDIVTDAMTAMNMSAAGTTKVIGKDGLTKEVQNATHFADVLAAASANSNTNVSLLGESFKYCAPLAGTYKFSIEDTAFALGLMANSGIKASQSGTAFRKILTQLSSDFKVLQKDGSDFIVKTTNTDGSMRDLKSILDDTRTAFNGMSEAEKKASKNSLTEAAKEQGIKLKNENGELKTQAELYNEVSEAVDGLTQSGKVQAAENLSGKTAMAGLLSVVNASETDYEKLAEAINNCDGAAEQMAAIRLNNLNGDVTILKSGMEGLGVQIYDEMKGPLREIVQYATLFVSTLSKKLTNSGALNNFMNQIKKNLPTVIRNVKEFTTAFLGFIEPLLNVGNWLLKNPDIVVSTLVGIGTALVTFKVANKIIELATAFQALTPAGAIVLGIAGAITAIAGVATYIKIANDEMKKQNLAEHFGSISLSLEDLQEVAKHIIQTDSLGKVKEALGAMEDLGAIENSIQDTVDILNKMNWKVSIGMNLTEDEAQTYKDNIVSYVQDVQDYVTQNQYAVTLAVGALINNDGLENSNVVSQINTFYAGKQEELAKAGKELNDAVTEGFLDGLLEVPEMEKITELQQSMAKIQSELAGNEFAGKLEVLSLKYGGGELDAESFQNLQAEINEMLQTAVAEYDESLSIGIANAKVMLKDGALNQEEYDKQVEDLKKGYLENVGDIELKAQSFQMETITGQYSDEIKRAIPEFESVMDDTMQTITDYANSGVQDMDWSVFWDEMLTGIADFDGMDDTTKVALSDLYEQLLPTIEQMESTKSKFKDFGMEIPEEINKGLKDASVLGALASNTDAIWQVVADTAEDNEKFKTAIETVRGNGNEIPEELAAGMNDNKKVIVKEVGDLYDTLDGQLTSIFKNGFNINVPVNFNLKHNPEQVKGWAAQTAPDIKNGHADGGIFDTPHVAWFAEAGPEAAIPIDGSQNALNLWKTTGEMLGIEGVDENSDTKPVSFTQLQQKMEKNDYNPDKENIKDIGTPEITYSPVLNFYGSAPNGEDLNKSLKTSQEEFNSMMQQWVKNNRRLSFS